MAEIAGGTLLPQQTGVCTHRSACLPTLHTPPLAFSLHVSHRHGHGSVPRVSAFQAPGFAALLTYTPTQPLPNAPLPGFRFPQEFHSCSTPLSPRVQPQIISDPPCPARHLKPSCMEWCCASLQDLVSISQSVSIPIPILSVL